MIQIFGTRFQHVPRVFLQLRGFPTLLAVSILLPTAAAAQCAGRVDSLATTANCVAHALPATAAPTIDPQRRYRLDELVDIAESNNPRTRVAWERARQASDRLHLARGAYYPELTLLAFFGDERIVNPFPKPLAPRGYTMVEIPTVAPTIGLEYALWDSGKRSSLVAENAATRLAAAAAFERANQDVALAVVRCYYDLVTAEQRLDAAQKILSTAQTTEDAAKAQLDNGRATLPDVLNARAARAQAAYDLEDAAGAARIARVALRESLDVEPSEQIEIAQPAETPALETVTESIQELVDSARTDRPDLQQLSQQVRAAAAAIRAAKSAQHPSLELESKLGQTAMWPTSDYGLLGAADQTTWSAGVTLRWNLFDGGRRIREVSLARSEARQRQDELEEQRDRTTREVWTSYLAFHTAVRQREAADILLNAAETSYNASFEAYGYGVKNLIDVVTAEQQLARARLAHVQASSAVWIGAVQLEYATGSLLRGRAPLTAPAPAPRTSQP
jgi:outer membrane protein TolC